MSKDTDSSQPGFLAKPLHERTPDETQARADFEWALHDETIQRQYAHQVIIVYEREVLGAGRNHDEAWAQALTHPRYPHDRHPAGQTVVITGVPRRLPIPACESAPRLYQWLFTPNAGWTLFYVAVGLLGLGIYLGLSKKSLVGLVICGSLAVMLSFVGGVWAILQQKPSDHDTN